MIHILHELDLLVHEVLELDLPLELGDLLPEEEHPVELNHLVAYLLVLGEGS